MSSLVLSENPDTVNGDFIGYAELDQPGDFLVIMVPNGGVITVMEDRIMYQQNDGPMFTSPWPKNPAATQPLPEVPEDPYYGPEDR